MPVTGKLECNRCRLQQIQDEAARNKMSVTMRKSVYGLKRDGELKPAKAGVDIFMHPQSLEIPSNHKCFHNMDMSQMETSRMFLDDQDPDKWIFAWLPEIPKKCRCKLV